MKEMKASVAMTLIQSLDAALRDCKQMRIGLRFFCACVWEVAEQGEIEARILVREVMDLESFDQFLHL